MNSIRESLKPVFIILVVLTIAGLLFIALRLDKTPALASKGQFVNWKAI